MKFRVLNIKQRVLLITLLPLLIITLFLGGYFISTRLDDAHSALLEKGHTISKMLASSAEFGVLTSSKESLNNLISSSVKMDSEIVDVMFLDLSFNLITRHNHAEKTLKKGQIYPLIKDKKIHFLQPVLTSGVDFSDNPDLASEAEEPKALGWVMVILSQEPTLQRQLEIVQKGTLLALFVLIVTLMLAISFGRRITDPILGLTSVVERLQKGHLETRANTSSTGELKTLAQGINKLAQRVYESRQTLVYQVDEATKQLRATLIHLEKQNHDLERANKEADLANIAKDEFLARMSHELRTPLTSVSGFSRLLKQTELKDEQIEYTRIINLTSDLLLSIIDDILDFSKLESNAVELESLTFEFDSAVIDILEMQTASANNKGVQLIPIIAADTPIHLIGDPIRFRQILSNLVSNAVKFTHTGHVMVDVHCSQLTPHNCQLHIKVIDTGQGIPEDKLSNLFQAFGQADTSITRKYGGSGLGLVIAKKLTELMGGTISLSSQAEKGTEVSLSIPFTIDANKPLQQEVFLQDVILLDGHQLSRTGLVAQLSRLTTSITLAQNETELLNFCEKKTDVPVIWSLQPKQMSTQLVEQLQYINSNIDAPIIVLCTKPLPLPKIEKLIQLRKPTRTQLLQNALAPKLYQLPQAVDNIETLLQQHIKVLIAEDNDFNRLLLCKMLEQAGCQIIEATNGEEAIQQALSANPDIILMDVHMPILDGIEATKKIRISLAKIPILALTANIIPREHERLIAAGIDDVLLKPISETDLIHALNLYTNIQAEQQGRLSHLDQLNKLDIEKSKLDDELHKQLAGIEEGFINQDFEKMRHHCHQLNGFSGLYDIPEIEVSAYSLYEALQAQDIRLVWKAFSQLKRLIKQEITELTEGVAE